MGKLNIEKFVGTVILKDWISAPDNRSVYGLTGVLTVLKATDVLDFEPTKTESNWLVRVENYDGTKSFNVLGCQVRTIIQDPKALEFPTPSYYRMV